MEVVMWASIIGALIGAFLAGAVGVYTAHRTLNIRDEKDKGYVSRALLSEVQLNQKVLKVFADLPPTVEKIKQQAKESGLDTLLEPGDLSLGNNLLPKEIRFGKTIYSALADKIGLLDSRSTDNLVLYYTNISLLEVMLISLYKSFSEEQDPLYKETATKVYCTEAETVYKMGEELIKSLKEKKADGEMNNIN